MTRWLAIRIGAEAIKVGLAHGYALEPVYHIPPEKLLAAGEGDKAAREECEATLLEQVKHRNDDQRPSMGQDILKGRRTEIDYINGLVAAKGAELKIATPANDGIGQVVRRIERGEIPPSPEAVAHI
jgi:2-dehydropantoate 2-reductase